MKTLNIIKSSFAALVLLAIAGCTEFLDRQPLAEVSSDKFLWKEGELATYSSAKYALLPTIYGLGLNADNNSDNSCGLSENSAFLFNRKSVPASSDWNFSVIRDCNYFLANVLPRYKEKQIEGSDALIRQYIGEIYFFRAFRYFDLLRQYGDMPIVTETLPLDYGTLAQANQRRPRNEVARFILDDLNKAIDLLQATPSANRIGKKVAQLFAARVALFEGTWLKYHKGTARVPKGMGWPGEGKPWLAAYTIDIDAEVAFFLGEAMTLSKIVADEQALAPDYAALFNVDNAAPHAEALLWRRYNMNLSPFVGHRLVRSIQFGGGKVGQPGKGYSGAAGGYTRAMIESFLMTNGKPIYDAGSNYQGDVYLAKLRENRDRRLVASISVPGDLMNESKSLFLRADMTGETENISASSTGYTNRKGWRPEARFDDIWECAISEPLFRAAEAYLIYMEASYIVKGSIDADASKYWTALRKRAGVSEDFAATIAATDLTKENDWGVWSGASMIDATLYNIRRERRCEFIGEGLRKDDLYRWRALDNMKEHHFMGVNMWSEYYKSYPDKVLKPEGTAGANISKKGTVSGANGDYVHPYRKVASNAAFKGYTFPKAHYLEPIGFDAIRLSVPVSGADLNSAVLYQNPGWPVVTGSFATE